MARVAATVTGTTRVASGHHSQSTLGGFAGGLQHKAVAPVAYTLTVSPGSFAITGSAATLQVGRKLVASAGSAAITGSAASLARGRFFTASPGSVAATGSPVTPPVYRVLLESPGSFTITGDDADLVAPSAPVVIQPTGGGHVFAVAPRQLRQEPPRRRQRQRELVCEPAAMSITGFAASLLRTRDRSVFARRIAKIDDFDRDNSLIRISR